MADSNDINGEEIYGTHIYAMSNSSLDQYPSNSASSFENTLKSRIKLNPNLRYNVKLHNYHIPLHEVCLVGGDYVESNIQYNMAVFTRDPLAHYGGYTIDQSTIKKLFSLAPDKDIEGIFNDRSDYYRFANNIKHPNNFAENDKMGGKPSLRSLKDDFIHRLGTSLKLNPNEPNDIVRDVEKKTLELLKSQLYPGRNNDTSNLMGRFFSDLNYFLFDGYTHIDQKEMFHFTNLLMITAGYSNDEIFAFLHVCGRVPPSLTQNMRYGPWGASQQEQMSKHLDHLEDQWAGLSKVHGLSDKELRSILKKDLFESPDDDDAETMKEKLTKKRRKKRRKLRRLNEELVRASRSIRSTPHIDVNDRNAAMDFLLSLKPQAIKQPEAIPTPQAQTAQENESKLVENDYFLGIYVSFGRRMANFFNLKENQYILLSCFGFPNINYTDYYMKLTPNFKKPKIDKLMVYSDVVKPTIRVGDFNTNLLDVISVDDSDIVHRPYVGSGNRPLRKHTIDSVAIHCTDDRGKPIHFERNAKSTFELHITPANEK